MNRKDVRRVVVVLGTLLTLSGCDRGPVCGLPPGVKSPSTLPELLKAHDGEVREHGKDICYIQPIGAFGRLGVLASLQHVSDRGGAVSSYNNTELVFGVAQEARMKTGYDICKDAPTLSRISAIEKAANAPAHQRTMLVEFVSRLCKAAP